MPIGTLNNIKVKGISTACPKNMEDLSKYHDSFGKKYVEKVQKTTGIKTRPITGLEQTASDLAFIACENLMSKLGESKDDIDALVFVTQTPDYKIPATACVLQYRLGLKNDCIAFDVNLGCSGYSYGLFIVGSLMQNPSVKKALLLVGDTSNKPGCFYDGISQNDKSSCMLFGEAGAATLLERVDDPNESMDFLMETDGSGFKNIIIPFGGNRNIYGSREKYEFDDGIIRSDYDFYMNGLEVFNYTINDVPKSVRRFIRCLKIDRESIDMVAFHQANLFILKNLAKRMRIPTEKCPTSIEEFGNTSVTSIPLTICHAIEKGDFSKEILNVLCVGFGVGLSTGIVRLNIAADTCFPIIYSNDFYDFGDIKPNV